MKRLLQRLTPLFSPPHLRFQTEKAREERAQAALAKKKPKPGVVAKSSVVLEIKPWDDETDLGELEKAVRSVEMQGLLWGKSELRPVVRVHSTIRQSIRFFMIRFHIQLIVLFLSFSPCPGLRCEEIANRLCGRG